MFVESRLAVNHGQGRRIPIYGSPSLSSRTPSEPTMDVGVNLTLLVADYSALEVVILADLCKRLFNDTQLEAAVAPGAPDIHVENAKKVFGFYLGWTVPEFVAVEGVRIPCPYAGQRVDDIPSGEFKKHPYGAVLRNMIKTVWYGLQYGKGAYGFSTLPGADGRPIGEDVAQVMLDSIAKAVPGPFRWQRWCRNYVDKNRGIYSLGGRWCPLEDESAPRAPEWLRNRGYRRAYNFPIQASAAELIGDAMVRVGRCEELKALGFTTCLQVHDELVLRGPISEIERASELLKLHMESATCNGTKLLVPLQVSTGHGSTYFDAK
jgi:DNA polymerase I-like protein with 3'-5' exonuclease and polymerase domains